ncbi:hypothetical protein BRADI_4g14275v3 [Brachypodium distachyon]|uniref:Uncharacterized protein n=1 Tax=Brachypodium distachyon TaxID=15368 RepID=A0A2K2CMS3_BRADI|nr:hypothetical protein BRADI_4g14275v3 [Brachypodium distachyon]
MWVDQAWGGELQRAIKRMWEMIEEREAEIHAHEEEMQKILDVQAAEEVRLRTEVGIYRICVAAMVVVVSLVLYLFAKV